MAKRLRRRAEAADRMVDRQKEEMPDKVTIYEDDAGDVARKIAAIPVSFWQRKYPVLDIAHGLVSVGN